MDTLSSRGGVGRWGHCRGFRGISSWISCIWWIRIRVRWGIRARVWIAIVSWVRRRVGRLVRTWVVIWNRVFLRLGQRKGWWLQCSQERRGVLPVLMFACFAVCWNKGLKKYKNMIFEKTKIWLALADTFANYNVQAAHYFLVPRAKSASFFAVRRSAFVGIKRSFTILSRNIRDYLLLSSDMAKFCSTNSMRIHDLF